MAISYEKYRLLRESVVNLGIFDPLAHSFSEKKKNMGENPEDEELKNKKVEDEDEGEEEEEESEEEEDEDESEEDEKEEEDELPDDSEDEDEEEDNDSEDAEIEDEEEDKFCGKKMMKKDAKKKCTCSDKEAVEKAEEVLKKDLDGDKEKGESKDHKKKVLKKESTEDKFLAIARSYGRNPLVKDREVTDFKTSIRNHFREGAKRHGNWDGISMKEDMLLARNQSTFSSADGEVDQVIPDDGGHQLNDPSQSNAMWKELTPEDMHGSWT
jgi:hypothetical protein